MSSTGFSWDAAAISTLRAGWKDGLSTAEIARRLGTSKNAVVGKAHREGCEARPSPIAGRNGHGAAVVARRFWSAGSGSTLPPLQSLVAPSTVIAAPPRSNVLSPDEVAARHAARLVERRAEYAARVGYTPKKIKPARKRSSQTAPEPRSATVWTAPLEPAGRIRHSPFFSPNKNMRPVTASDEALIAEYITSKGVTRCPAAAVELTQASISAEDRAALSAHQAAMDKALLLSWKRRCAARGNAASKRAALRSRIQF